MNLSDLDDYKQIDANFAAWWRDFCYDFDDLPTKDTHMMKTAFEAGFRSALKSVEASFKVDDKPTDIGEIPSDSTSPSP